MHRSLARGTVCHFGYGLVPSSVVAHVLDHRVRPVVTSRSDVATEWLEGVRGTAGSPECRASGAALPRPAPRIFHAGMAASL